MGSLLSRVGKERTQRVEPEVVVQRDFPQETTHCGRRAVLLEISEGHAWYLTTNANGGETMIRDTVLDVENPFDV